MSVTYDNASGNKEGADSSPLTWSHTIGSGSDRLLVVGVTNNLETETVSVKYNTVPMTEWSHYHALNDIDNPFLTFFYLKENQPAGDLPTTGSYTVEVTYGGDITVVTSGAISFSNVDQTTPLRNKNDNSANGVAMDTSVTSSVGNMVVMFVGSGTEHGTLGGAGNPIERVRQPYNEADYMNNITGVTAAGASDVQITYTTTGDVYTWIGADVVAVMDFHLLQSATGSTSVSMTVSSRSLIVIFAGWSNGSAGNISISDDLGHPFTIKTYSHIPNENGQFGFLLAATAGSRVFTITYPSGSSGQWAVGMEFSYSSLISYNTEGLGTGSGQYPVSGNFSLTSNKQGWLVVGGVDHAYGGVTFSKRYINEVYADGSRDGTYGTMFYKVLESPFTNGHVQCTVSESDTWVCNAVAFYKDSIESACWGHDTGVQEGVVSELNTWLGTGLVTGTGDTERLVIGSGQYMESNDIETGEKNITLAKNKYAAGMPIGASSFIAEYPTAFNNVTTPKTAMNAVAVNAGDILIAIGVCENTSDIVSITENGTSSWVLKQSTSEADYSPIYLWTYEVTSNETLTVTFTATGDIYFGGTVLRFGANGGVGINDHANAASGDPAITLNGVSDNSVIVEGVSDWSGVTGTQTGADTAGNCTEKTGYPGDINHYGVFVGYYSDTGIAGNKTVGQSDPNGLKWAIVAVEIKSPPESFYLVPGGFAEGYAGASGISIATSGTITVANGDLIVVFASFQDGASTTITISDGKHTYAHEAVISEPTAAYGYAVHAYVLNAIAGTYTFTATFGAARTYRAIYAYAFRPPLGNAVSRLDYKSGSGTTANFLTSNLSTDGTETDSVMVAGEVQSRMGEQLNELIGESLTRADDSIGYQGGVFYTFSTGSINGSHAQCSSDGVGDHAIGVIAFKSAAISLQYKTASTQAGLVSESYQKYVGEFTSLGWVKIKVLV